MIKSDVLTNHLVQYAHERILIEGLINSFEINWARARKAYNTTLSCYIIDPTIPMREMFGFNTEIALFISSYNTVQSRTIQAINDVLHDEPMRGRVDKSIFIVILRHGQNAEEFKELYRNANNGVIPVVITEYALKQAKKNTLWGVKNLISEQLFTQDLFDDQLPLKNDYGFFGRKSLVQEFSEAVSRGNNRGLFGLRKTGKTSLLFKLIRTLNHKDDVNTIYYDCKKPIIRKKTASEFLNLICDDILKALGRNTSFASSEEPYSRIENIFATISEKKTICIIFDEIEYISYFARMNPHWKNDFIDFWQTLWSIQSETGKLCFIITGVNAKVVEDDLIDGIQNPLFGIVPTSYLTGLEEEELHSMIKFLGTRMGLVLSTEAMNFLYNRFGGHPLLTRKACSFINSYFEHNQAKKPTRIDQDFVKNNSHNIDGEVKFYFTHILSGVREFYKEEYDILEMIASGETIDARELIIHGYEVDHLKKYGLINISKAQKPSFSIDCLKEFITQETAKSEQRLIPYREINASESNKWLTARLTSISHDLKLLSQLCESETGTSLFLGHAVGNPETYFSLSVVTSKDDLKSFLIEMNKCIIETSENFNRAMQNYFFKFIKENLPHLFIAFLRIKAYRNHFCHTELTGKSLDAFKQISNLDFGTENLPDLSNSGHVIIQQIIMNELSMALQEEIANRSP